MKFHQPTATLLSTSTLLLATTAYATNGMLMEGYGPISTAMGGASQAIEHGNAAMAQNPATLGLMPDGTSRLDLAIGELGPKVRSSTAAESAESGGDSYVMPAVGYVKRVGPLTYGVGMFAQGGMGTEYGADAWLSAPAGVSSNLPSRSELGVGNVLFPVTYQFHPDWIVGATFRFMWSSLDMRMTASGAQLGQMVADSGQAPSGNFAQMLPGMAGAPWANISFSDDNDFTGAAKATGWGGSLGTVWRATPEVTVGASYQFQTALDDMETGATSATLSAMGGFADHGRLTVLDFQMPAVFAIGASWLASPTWLFAADIRNIEWSDVMESFRMRYDSANGLGSVHFTMPQHWKDQVVLNLGAAWKANDRLTLRAGLNLSDNPVPDGYVCPMFPATVSNHVSVGGGYALSDTSAINVSLTHAPSHTVQTPTAIDISHGQTNLMLMYSQRF
ncbi:OmpP1/FadL family transporter [Candidatus Symbiobacter mobilis]|uniref:Long-chain fatty acid transport protein n=1 Tax=Candidatus Symbiobacter mobilis CR TaxID=946483 RepID=U5NEJ5_9BURK|nr:outer membrane protein transport protein [Candidatus Symbiobacter mobilis]AGX88574.1 long-chain fatty acid transport protein [Candidatus Symbiobacter mobilis CR]